MSALVVHRIERRKVRIAQTGKRRFAPQVHAGDKDLPAQQNGHRNEYDLVGMKRGGGKRLRSKQRKRGINGVRVNEIDEYRK